MFKTRLLKAAQIKLIIAAVVTILSSQSTFAQRGDTAAQESPGMAIGEKFPEVTLPKQDGKEVSVNKLLEKGPVAIVFYRSASW